MSRESTFYFLSSMFLVCDVMNFSHYSVSQKGCKHENSNLIMAVNSIVFLEVEINNNYKISFTFRIERKIDDTSPPTI